VTINSNQLVESDAGGASGSEGTFGWRQVALAINSVRTGSAPMFLKVLADSHDPLYIDLLHGAYSWSVPLNEFPEDAAHIWLETEPATEDATPPFELPGQSLDSLLWVLGSSAFGADRASWLPEGERYRLTQWPNLSRHFHNMHQMHMLAILGNAFFAPAELAKVSGVPVREAQRLINALSLMGLLRNSAEVEAVAVSAPTKAKKNASLFSRLLNRLGR
jgi:hypothetical protein